MPNFLTIAKTDDISVARILLAALKAHGFNPLEGGEEGLPGMPGITGLGGIVIQVPANEAADAKVLADALLAEMTR